MAEPIDTTVETRFERKTLDTIMRAAFEAGVRHGAHYPEYAAIPEWEKEAQFRAFKDDLQGNTWGPQDWFNARQAGLAKERIQRAETEAGLW